MIPRSLIQVLAVLFVAGTLFRPAVAGAQEELAHQRASLERQQQSDRFALELRQSQQQLGAPAYGPERQALDALDLQQQQEQERLQQDQRRRAAGRSASSLAAERASQQVLFDRQIPAWGPSLAPAAPPRWTPTLEPVPSGWTPTL